jgi:hypothetical protein
MTKRERAKLCAEMGLPFTTVAYETEDGRVLEPPVYWGVISTPADSRLFIEHANNRMRWESLRK